MLWDVAVSRSRRMLGPRPALHGSSVGRRRCGRQSWPHRWRGASICSPLSEFGVKHTNKESLYRDHWHQRIEDSQWFWCLQSVPKGIQPHLKGMAGWGAQFWVCLGVLEGLGSHLLLRPSLSSLYYWICTVSPWPVGTRFRFCLWMVPEGQCKATGKGKGREFSSWRSCTTSFFFSFKNCICLLESRHKWGCSGGGHNLQKGPNLRPSRDTVLFSVLCSSLLDFSVWGKR